MELGLHVVRWVLVLLRLKCYVLRASMHQLHDANHHFPMSPLDHAQLLDQLKSNISVTSLDLSQNQLTDEGAQVRAKARVSLLSIRVRRGAHDVICASSCRQSRLSWEQMARPS